MEESRIVKLLPEIFRSAAMAGTPLDAVLAIMAACHGPAEAAITDLDANFDPRRAPDAFVVMLAGWVALDPYLTVHGWERDGRRGRVAIDLGNLRELTTRAAELARLRGTLGTLRTFLELATGLSGFAIEENPAGVDGRPQPFHARVQAPMGARTYQDLIALIVAREKPAFTTVEIAYADA
jgi:phage tail-like protein